MKISILLFSFLFIVGTTYSYAYAATDEIVINLDIPTSKYYTNEKVNLEGRIFDPNNDEGIKSHISIKVEDNDKNTIYQYNIISKEDGKFGYSFKIEDVGVFEIILKNTHENIETQISKTIKVNSPLGCKRKN